MVNFPSRSLCAFLVVALIGCGGLQRSVAFDAGDQIIQAGAGRDAARAILRGGSCPTQAPAVAAAATPVVAGAIAALAPVVADFSVRLLQNYLARVQSEQTASYRASGTGTLRGDTAEVQACLIVVRGRFGAAPRADLAQMSGVLSPELLAGLGLSTYPTLYMEASFRGDPAANAVERAVAAASGSGPHYLHLLIRPEALQFARTAAFRAGDGRKAVGMVVLLRAEPLGRGATEEQAREGALLAVPFDFGIVQEGTAIRAVPGAAGSSHPFADQERAVRVPVLSATANIDVFITEAGEPGRVLELLAATLRDNEATIEKAISDAIRAAAASQQGGAR